ncbi:calcium-activated potassium channel subunit alpha-1-like [Polyodon spathula]|uniref:calcium-activated potassium channel subunit alpha-1-like n=1 Tax=Polyodon spathula TaxID=7913 RepID=UPI001B7DCE67|nr:calcium-activated potassium channel subunit alpha-1-like [Polyodon spathula]
MAQGCMVPGLSTLLANLFTMQSPAQAQPGSWRSHYKLGLYNEVYTEELSRDFTGKHFDKVCRDDLQTHPAWEVKGQLDSTGIFHWCQPVPLESITPVCVCVRFSLCWLCFC